jgi:hypothetical protein
VTLSVQTILAISGGSSEMELRFSDSFRSCVICPTSGGSEISLHDGKSSNSRY